ncbi:DoxX family protein [Terrimonas sp. NA20]|uniref:DoxX family protein n=1 Tax=Terrimonas ginsenosidimutans TaxID=2908004 RepID=A0ABS9KUC5_9BACT|nr:DoxX family protein [Terrimonas ginsenosidimutans]
MKTNFDVPQLLLRIALGLGFIFPVMDRMGWLGLPGEMGNAWGNWHNFISYTYTLMPYLDLPVVNIIGAIATVMEALFGIAMIIGFKTRMAAYGSAFLTLAFAVSMLLFAGYRAPFSYSVFVCSAASWLLAKIPYYKWSADNIA